MLAAMPLTLFVEWMDYYEVEPFGEERADLRCAIIAQVVASSIPSKSRRRVKVQDFMPSFEKTSGGAKRKTHSPEQMRSIFTNIVDEQNARMARKKPAIVTQRVEN